MGALVPSGEKSDPPNTHTKHTHTHTHTPHTCTHTVHAQRYKQANALTDNTTSDGERNAGIQFVDKSLDLGQVLLTELLHSVSHWLSLSGQEGGKNHRN